MAFQNSTVLNASARRAQERNCGLWRVSGTDIKLALRRTYCADIVEHSSEFVTRLNRIFSSETSWVGVIGAERLETFVRLHREGQS